MTTEPRSAAAWLLLHGTPLTPEVWRSTADLLGDQPVLVPDCTRVPGADAQRVLADRLARTIGDRQVDLVGHSFGGQVALELALRCPSRIRSLTVLCSRDTPFPAFAAAAQQLRSGSAPPVGGTLDRWFTPTELRANGPAVRRARRDLEGASLPDWAAALEAIAAFDRSDRTGGLTMPVELHAAGGDAVSSPAAMAELAARLPDSLLTVRPEWRHMSPFTDPAALASLLVSSRDRAVLGPRPR